MNTYQIDGPITYSENNWMEQFYAARLSDPVHYTPDSSFGPYWSITRYRDIMSVLLDHSTFTSSEGVTIEDQPPQIRRRSLIKMDPPDHTREKKLITPIMSSQHLERLKEVIRDRTASVVDSLPRNIEFNWAKTVSTELTSMMLATLLGIPIDDRNKLIYWADLATLTDYTADGALARNPYDKFEKLKEMVNYFKPIWQERAHSKTSHDMISLLAGNSVYNEADLLGFMGQLNLLIIGGLDTTRNTMSASLLYFVQNNIMFDTLRSDTSQVPNFIAETIRSHSPLIHVRRTATRDTHLQGKKISKGEKVVAWIISGNHDEKVFPDPHRFNLARSNSRRHLGYGAGVHRCLGAKLAELQLQILWDEIIRRNLNMKISGSTQYSNSNFIRGIVNLPVTIA